MIFVWSPIEVCCKSASDTRWDRAMPEHTAKHQRVVSARAKGSLVRWTLSRERSSISRLDQLQPNGDRLCIAGHGGVWRNAVPRCPRHVHDELRHDFAQGRRINWQIIV